MRWAGNPNIVIAAKFLGVKATVQVPTFDSTFLLTSIHALPAPAVQLLDLTLFATARITLRPLVPVFPCFAKIAISLMEKVLLVCSPLISQSRSSIPLNLFSALHPLCSLQLISVSK